LKILKKRKLFGHFFILSKIIWPLAQKGPQPQPGVQKGNGLPLRPLPQARAPPQRRKQKYVNDREEVFAK
jgi:hypothetical protein